MCQSTIISCHAIQCDKQTDKDSDAGHGRWTEIKRTDSKAVAGVAAHL